MKTPSREMAKIGNALAAASSSLREREQARDWAKTALRESRERFRFVFEAGGGVGNWIGMSSTTGSMPTKPLPCSSASIQSVLRKGTAVGFHCRPFSATGLVEGFRHALNGNRR
ncbi:hypothetical protein AB8841_23080 [Microvirga sp. TS319]